MQCSSVHIFGWHNDIQRKWGHFKHGYLWNLFEFEMICVCQHFFSCYCCCCLSCRKQTDMFVDTFKAFTRLFAYHNIFGWKSFELFCWPMMNIIIPVSEMKINIFILNIKVALIGALLIFLMKFIQFLLNFDWKNGFYNWIWFTSFRVRSTAAKHLGANYSGPFVI